MTGGERCRFVLDQNFPEPLLRTLVPAIPEAELVPLRELDRRLTRNVEDWQVMLALYHHPTVWDGLITTDSGILGLPREISVLLQTKLALVVPEAAGDDPLKATGLLLTHLPYICKNRNRKQAQLWILRATQKASDKPWDRLSLLARRANEEPAVFYEKHKLSPADFALDPRADLPTDE